MTDPTLNDYWPTLTPRQQLADAVHKYAQRTGTPYPAAWQLLRAHLAELWGREPDPGETLPAWLQRTGSLGVALEVALEWLAAGGGAVPL